MASYYINTDLDLASHKEFSGIMAGLDVTADVLYYSQESDGDWYACIEAAGSGFRDKRTPEDDIKLLIDAIQELRPNHMLEWNSLRKIEFNIGWQSASTRPEGAYQLSESVLKQIVELGGSVCCTIYPSAENDEGDTQQASAAER